MAVVTKGGEGESDAEGESGCVTYANDPVDAGVPADGRVGGVNADHLVPLEGTVGVHPVRVQHTEVSEGTSNLLLSNGLDVLLVLQLVHTRGLRLTVADTTVSRPLASSTADLWGRGMQKRKTQNVHTRIRITT